MGEVRWGFMTGWQKEKVITEDGLKRNAGQNVGHGENCGQGMVDRKGLGTVGL